MSFLNSVINNAQKFENPFIHWELNKPLTAGALEEITKVDIADPTKHNLLYDGTRAIDGGKGEFREGISSGGEALKFRCFINKENSINNYFVKYRSYEMDYFIKNNLISIQYSKFGIIEIKNSSLQESLEIVRRRIDEVGTNEPTIQIRGSERILVFHCLLSVW